MNKINPISWRKLSKVFELDGWKFSRTKGDHMVYTKNNFLRPIVTPKDSVVEVFIIKNNLKTAEITREKVFLFIEEDIVGIITLIIRLWLALLERRGELR